jgi:hypothetical protein
MGLHPFEPDRAERVLHRLAPLMHLFGMLVDTMLDRLKNVLVLPSGNPTLLAGSTTMLDDTALAGSGPVAAHGQSVLLGREVVGEPVASWTDINVLLGHVTEGAIYSGSVYDPRMHRTR